MYNDKTVAVIIPAYNEADQIGHVIDTIPDFVDRIVVVNDCSIDNTEDIVKLRMDTAKKRQLFVSKTPEKISPDDKYKRADYIRQQIELEENKYFEKSHVVNTDPIEDRIILINQLKNIGVGAAIARGYKWCKDYGIDCCAVMAGDGQMDPDELESICEPVIKEHIDYVKGNRLIHRSAWSIMPKSRFLGNAVLSILTKIASGYWHISDTQTGYTAISQKALQSIPLHKIYARYGVPNDILVKLNIVYATVKEVEIKPVYNIGEKSKMKIFRVILPISSLLIKSFFKRLWLKYFFRDFHPLFLLYHLSFILCLANTPYYVKIIRAFIEGTQLSYEPLLAFIFLFTASFQSLFFAMWMDIQDNQRLYK